MRIPPTLTAAIAGASFAPVFRRHEPTLYQFTTFSILIALVARGSSVSSIEGLLFDSPAKAAISFATFMLGLSLSILYYRLLSSSHPLSHIPGPILARATKLWLFAKIQGGKSREDLEKIHAIYGPVVRIAPNEISVADNDAILQIHGAKSWIRGTSYTVSFHSSGGAPDHDVSMLNLISHASHTPRRRMWDRAFTIASLKEYEPMVLERISELCTQMDRLEGTVIDMNKWMGYLVFDVTSDLAYGGGSSFLRSGSDPTDLVEGVVAAMRLQGRLMALPWLAPVLKHSSLATKSASFGQFCTSQFETRYKNGNPRGGIDFLTHLMEGEGKDALTLSKKAMAGESSLVMAAGADTTRVAISILFMYVIRDPKLYETLQRAIDEALDGAEMVNIGDGVFPAHDVVKNIPMLEAFINEALRVAPPLSVEPLREAPTEGASICDIFIPGGTQVRVLSSVIQRDPRNHADPLEFRPERWLKAEQGGSGDHFDKRAFFPFLFGPYHCVGKQFAYQEMRLFVATLLWKYDLSFAPGFNPTNFYDAVEENGSILELRTPLKLVFKRRVKA